MATTAGHEQYVRDVILRDGRTLRLRTPAPSDAQLIIEFFSSLDDEGRYLRFHGVRRIDASVLTGLIDPDWSSYGALIGTLVVEGAEQVIAVANYARLRDPEVAEVAFAVARPYRGDGIATRLLEQLAVPAQRHGITQFSAEVMTADLPMLEVFAHSGMPTTRRSSGSETQVQMWICPTAESAAARAARDHVGVEHSLTPILAPRVIAVVGASARSDSVGAAVVRNIEASGFGGVLYAVNRSGTAAGKTPALTRIADLPEPPDLAVVCVPAVAAAGAVAEVLEAGARSVCVISTGFAETGQAGADGEHDLVELARGHGARIVGPNCLGVASTHAPRFNATFAANQFTPGSIAVGAQSGAVGLAMCDGLAQRGQGVSAFVSIGNAADVTANDLIDYWEGDPATNVIALYTESFGGARQLGRLAQRVSGTKPIVALRGGVTAEGSQAARSHTAALAAGQKTVEGLFQQTGILHVDSLQELLDLSAALATQPLPAGKRVAVVSNAGGLGILCADACGRAGLELATLQATTRERVAGPTGAPPEAIRNPVDLGGASHAEEFGQAVAACLDDARTDGLVVVAAQTAVTSRAEFERVTAAAAADSSKPVVACFVGDGRHTSAEVQLSIVEYPESTVKVMASLVHRAQWLRRPAGWVVPTEVDRAAVDAALGGEKRGLGPGWLPPAQVRRLLAAFGIHMIDQRIVDHWSQAREAAFQFGYPLAVKSAEPGLHKRAAGKVVLGVHGDTELSAALATVGTPALIQPMAHGMIEWMAGAFQDPVFGPTVGFGLGGSLVETIDRFRIVPAPLTDVDAAELVAYPAGEQPDAAALEDLVRRLSQLITDVPEVLELDLNPVIAGASGLTVIDARVRVGTPPNDTPETRTW